MSRKGAVLCLAVSLLVSAVPATASAQEIAITVGRFLGDDVLDEVPIVGPPAAVGFADGMLYGVRFSMGALFAEFEATLASAGSKVLADTEGEFSARFTYAEAGVAIKIFPGPIAPFVAGGIGYHRIGWGVDGASSYGNVGYYLGAGLKVGLGKVGIRGDLRDHITPIKFESLDPLVAAAIGIEDNVTVHNFELSVALTLSF
jgi:hypothetical protein